MHAERARPPSGTNPGRRRRHAGAQGFTFPPEVNARERLAFHEAAHAVAARAFGLSVGPVTIEPGKSFAGACFHGPPRSRFVAAIGPTVLWPASFRKMFEADAVIAFAGDIASELYDAERLTRPAPADRDAAVRKVRAVLERHTGELPRAESAKLQEARNREKEERVISKDWESALEAAGILAPRGSRGPDTLAAPLDAGAARRPLAGGPHRGWCAVERGTLSRKQIRELLAGTK